MGRLDCWRGWYVVGAAMTDLDTCRWCGGAHPIEFCGEVMAACGVTPDRRKTRVSSAYLPHRQKPSRAGRPKSGMGDSNKRAVHDSYPCVVYGYEAPRATGR